MTIRFTTVPFKGTVSVISSDPPCTDDNARFATVYLENLNLIKNVEDIVVFLTRKSVYFCDFFIASYTGCPTNMTVSK